MTDLGYPAAEYGECKDDNRGIDDSGNDHVARHINTSQSSRVLVDVGRIDSIGACRKLRRGCSHWSAPDACRGPGIEGTCWDETSGVVEQMRRVIDYFR